MLQNEVIIDIFVVIKLLNNKLSWSTADFNTVSWRQTANTQPELQGLHHSQRGAAGKEVNSTITVKWYMKCFIYWTADLKSSELCNCYGNASELCNCLNCVHNCDDHSSLEHYYWLASSRKFLMIALCLLILAGRYHRHFCLLYWKPSSFFIWSHPVARTIFFPTMRDNTCTNLKNMWCSRQHFHRCLQAELVGR